MNLIGDDARAFLEDGNVSGIYYPTGSRVFWTAQKTGEGTCRILGMRVSLPGLEIGKCATLLGNWKKRPVRHPSVYIDRDILWEV